MAAHVIRQMIPSDASQVLALRQRALLEEPLAFLASPEDDAAKSIEVVQEMLNRTPNSVVFGAEADGLVGMLGFYRESRTKAAHKAQLWGMFVAPEYRGAGIGRDLLRSALSHARSLDGIATVNLSVATTAEAARHIYEREGFVSWGCEPDAIRDGADVVDEYHLRYEI